MDLPQLLARLAEPGWRTPQTVERLHAEVLRLVYADVDEAERAAGAAAALADQLHDPRSRALALRARGHVAYARVRHEEAVSCYREAIAELEPLGAEIDIARTLSGGLQPLILLGRYDEASAWAARARDIFERHGDRLRLARLATNVGNMLYRQDRYEEALEQYNHAYEQFQSIGEPLDLTAVLSNLAVCHISRAQFEQALHYYNLARAQAAAHGQKLLVAGADYNIAYLYYLRGDYLKAMELYQASRSHCQIVGDAYHAALCDLDESEMCLELNLNQEARYLARQASIGFHRLRMPYEQAKALANYALAENRRGDWGNALKGFRHARRLFQKEGNDLWPALIDFYEAIVFRHAGRRTDAVRLSRRAQRHIPASWLPGKAMLCRLLEAQVLLETGLTARAREICREVLQQAPPDSHSSRFHAWFLLAQVEEARQNWEGAYQACREAAGLAESLRNRMPGEEIRISFLKDKLAVYESLVRLCLDRHPQERMIEEAVRHIQQAKSRVLADQMAGLERQAAGAPAPTGDVGELRRQLHWHYRRIETEASDGRSGVTGRIRILQQETREREAQLARKLAEGRLAASDPAVLQGEGEIPVEVLCHSVPEDAILLEYYRVRDAFHVCLMSRNGLEMVRLSDSRRVRQLLHLLQFQLAKFNLGVDYLKRFGPALRAAVENHLRALYGELIAPIRHALHASHLIIAPHTFLHHLPFHALYDGHRFLIDDFSVSYAPSASVYSLSATRRSGANDGSSLILGVPDAGTPFVLDEVETVVERLPNARSFLGDQATDEVLHRYGPSSRFLHIATHGVFRRDNPLFSSIRLGNSHLNLFDLYQMSLSAELVTLSGCSTGLHTVEGGDELLGLVRGLLCAGARAAVVSLWDVNDSTTACLMGAFYNEIRAGRNKALALRNAMCSLREFEPHPYYWAPFVVVGKYGQP